MTVFVPCAIGPHVGSSLLVAGIPFRVLNRDENVVLK